MTGHERFEALHGFLRNPHKVKLEPGRGQNRSPARSSRQPSKKKRICRPPGCPNMSFIGLKKTRKRQGRAEFVLCVLRLSSKSSLRKAQVSYKTANRASVATHSARSLLM